MSLHKWLATPEWLLEKDAFERDKINFEETLFTVGNGYLGTRGTLEEGTPGECSGTFLSGVFDHHDATVIDLVNAPDWLSLSIRVDGQKLDMLSCSILEHRRALDMRNGLLYRITRFKDDQGRITRYESIRFASFSNQHICCIRAELTAENYSEEIQIESAIEGERYNLDRLPDYAGLSNFHPDVKWEKWAKSKHMETVSRSADSDTLYLQMKTLDTDHHLGYATALHISGTQTQRKTNIDYERVAEHHNFHAQEGVTYTLDKLVAIETSRDIPKSTLTEFCHDHLFAARQQGFEQLLHDHKEYWSSLWQDCDCTVSGDPEVTCALRFNTYHLLISANPLDSRVNIGAKTLSGEGYKGHVFWDTEIFMLPFFIYTQPETAKALLLYRYHTLSGALENARCNGFEGAQYPWESADSGLETTPKWTADGQNRIWTGEEEIHITADVAYGIVTYLTATDDWEFFCEYGAEILLQTARFWCSRLEYNTSCDHYELNRVIGPDEFHEHVDNNVFTNWMARWNLQKAIELYKKLKKQHPKSFRRICESIELHSIEVIQWERISQKITIPFDHEKQLIEQFEGYFQRKEVPIKHWDENQMPAYPQGYDHFNADETTLLKQPDVVMLMFILPDEFSDEVKQKNYAFYEQRTLHKSSLSPSMHSIMGIEVGDTEKAVHYFMRSALVDLTDNQGNTEWGIHAASTGGTWMSLAFGFGGFRVRNQQMTFKPWLPPGWQQLNFRLKWRGDSLSVNISAEEAVFTLHAEKDKCEEILVCGSPVTLTSNQDLRVPLTITEAIT